MAKPHPPTLWVRVDLALHPSSPLWLGRNDLMSLDQAPACSYSYVYSSATMKYVQHMASLTTPLSVRLADEDVAFLARLEIDGTVTASDKIRALIRQARGRADEAGSFEQALAMSHDHLAPALRRLRMMEQEEGVHSEVAVGLMSMAEEYLALALAAPRPGGDRPADALITHEARLVDCAARMAGLLLRWGVTSSAPAYDKAVVMRHLHSLIDLMNLISAAHAAPAEA